MHNYFLWIKTMNLRLGFFKTRKKSAQYINDLTSDRERLLDERNSEGGSLRL